MATQQDGVRQRLAVIIDRLLAEDPETADSVRRLASLMRANGAGHATVGAAMTTTAAGSDPTVGAPGDDEGAGDPEESFDDFDDLVERFAADEQLTPDELDRLSGYLDAAGISLDSEDD